MIKDLIFGIINESFQKIITFHEDINVGNSVGSLLFYFYLIKSELVSSL